MTCVCGFTPAARNAAIALALGRCAVGVQGRTSRPGDRVVTRSGGHGLDVDVEGIERRAVVVLGHVDSQGGSRGNLRAAVDQRADRFFLQNIPTRPPLHEAGPIASHRGHLWGVYLFSPALPPSWRARRRPPWADSEPTGVVSGRTGVRAKAVLPLRARSMLHRAERSSNFPILRREREYGGPTANGNAASFEKLTRPARRAWLWLLSDRACRSLR